MTDEYITNMNPDEILDENEPLAKLKIAQAELAEIKNQLNEKNKLCLEQKHQIENSTIELNDLKDKLKNQENLLKFYQEKNEKENEEETEKDPEKKDKIKQLEIKNMKLEEKIKELEENKIKMENDYDVISQQLDEEKAIGQKALEFITEKDDEIEELKKKIKDYEEGGAADKKEGDLTEEEVQALKEEFLNQQEEFESYKTETAKKIKQYIDENNILLNTNNSYKDKNSNLELELIQLKEANERLENEKRINEKLLEEKNLKEDNKENEFIIEIQNLQSQLEETQRKNAENL